MDSFYSMDMNMDMGINYILDAFNQPKKYLDVFTDNTYEYIKNYEIPNMSDIVTSISHTISDNISDNFSNNINYLDDIYNKTSNNIDVSLIFESFMIFVFFSTFISILIIHAFNYFGFENNRSIQLAKMKINANYEILMDEENKNKNKISNTNSISNIPKTIITNTIDPESKIKTKFYINSMNEIKNQNTKIMEKLSNNKNKNYILLIRLKMKYYVSMQNTKYNMCNKDIKYNKYNDFITKDVYMIMGIDFNNTNNDDICTIIIKNINSINKYSGKEYVNEDFIIIFIAESTPDICTEITKGFTNINYELFNMKDIVLQFKNKENKLVFATKYTLILPVSNVYNMMLDICNNILFESKLYSIDNYNFEKWNGVPLSLE